MQQFNKDSLQTVGREWLLRILCILAQTLQTLLLTLPCSTTSPAETDAGAAWLGETNKEFVIWKIKFFAESTLMPKPVIKLGILNSFENSASPAACSSHSVALC